jgi:hypothetical protein
MSTPLALTSADAESKVELHSRACSCGGGSWMILGTASSAPCGKDRGGSPSGIVISVSEWRTAGKPNSEEAYAERSNRVAPGERREFKRYAVVLPVKLSRIPTWRDKVTQAEETVTDVIAQGGSLVRSRMAVEEGEILMFELDARYKTRAQILYITHGADETGPPFLRLGVRFLDELMPESLVPPGAEPLE